MSRRKSSNTLVFALLALVILLGALSSLLVHPVHPMECNQGIFEKIFNNDPNNIAGCNREPGLFYFHPDTLGLDK